MRRLWPFVIKYGLDLLIVVAADFSVAGTASRDDAYLLDSAIGHWFEVFAIAAVVLVLLWRRRAPFAAPTATWVISASLSFYEYRVEHDLDASVQANTEHIGTRTHAFAHPFGAYGAEGVNDLRIQGS